MSRLGFLAWAEAGGKGSSGIQDWKMKRLRFWSWILLITQKLLAPTPAGPCRAARCKTLQDFPPRQGADTLGTEKAVDEPLKKLESLRISRT